MTSRERFSATFAFRPVDRPLLDFHCEAAPLEGLRRHLGVGDTEGVLRSLQVDFRTIEPEYVGPALPKTTDGTEQDIWGIIRKPAINETGQYMEPVNRPWAHMRTVADVEGYPWPRVEWYDFSHFPELCRRQGDSIIVFGRAGLGDLIVAMYDEGARML